MSVSKTTPLRDTPNFTAVDTVEHSSDIPKASSSFNVSEEKLGFITPKLASTNIATDHQILSSRLLQVSAPSNADGKFCKDFDKTSAPIFDRSFDKNVDCPK